jgi:hypothetical protein
MINERYKQIFHKTVEDRMPRLRSALGSKLVAKGKRNSRETTPLWIVISFYLSFGVHRWSEHLMYV